MKTGLPKSAVQLALRQLKRRRLGAEEVGTQADPVRQVLRPWRRQSALRPAA